MVFEGARTSAADAIVRLGDVAAPWMRRRWGWLAAVLAGTAPLALAAPFGSALHQPASAVLVFLLLLGSLRIRSPARGIAFVLVAYGAHCAAAILLARHAPHTAAACFPDGADYWAKQLHWIQTGEDPEYILANWIPAHAQLVCAVVLLGAVSLGLLPLFEGFHEVDLMNFYVGRLLASSGDAPASLLFGWHPWSVARGIGFALLIQAVAAWSYRRISGMEAMSRSARAWTWGLGLGFLALDGLIKYGLLDVVRTTLAGRLEG